MPFRFCALRRRIAFLNVSSLFQQSDNTMLPEGPTGHGCLVWTVCVRYQVMPQKHLENLASVSSQKSEMACVPLRIHRIKRIFAGN